MSVHIIAIVVLLVLAATVGLSVRVILLKNGRFRSQHVSQSKAMRDRGISCVQSQDFQQRQKNHNAINVKQL